MKRLPRPMPSLDAKTLPRCISTRLRTKARPMPSPLLGALALLDLLERQEDGLERVGAEPEAVVGDLYLDGAVLLADEQGDRYRRSRSIWRRW